MFVGKTIFSNFCSVGEFVVNKFTDGFIDKKYTQKKNYSSIPLVIVLLIAWLAGAYHIYIEMGLFNSLANILIQGIQALATCVNKRKNPRKSNMHYLTKMCSTHSKHID